MHFCSRLFKEKKSLLKVFFQVQQGSSFGLIFMKLCPPQKLGTLGKAGEYKYLKKIFSLMV